MATYQPAKRATELIFYIGLEDQANAGLFKAAPTIAAGDFQVSKDGGALANLTTLPTVTPAAGAMVKITLSATEMTADNVTLVCIDVAGAEWYDLIIGIPTVANQFDDLPTNAEVNAEVDTAITDAVLATAASLATVDSNVDAILADTGTDGVVLSTATQQSIADETLGRSVSNTDATASTHSLYELIQAILESSTSTGSWVIYKTDGTTTFNTRTLVTNAAADPIVTVS